jgi:hypothetical protein
MLPSTFLPSKKTRDFCISDTEIALTNARTLVAEAGSVIAPDTLVVLDNANPDSVTEAITGMPVTSTDLIMGVTTTYSTNSATADGLVGVAKVVPGMTFRIKSNQALVNQAGVNAIIGSRFFIASSTDADGFIHQVLDVAGGVEITSSLKVVDGDFLTDTVLVEIS